MSTFIRLFAIIALSVSTLRLMREQWTRQQLPRWALWIDAPVAWILVASCGFWIVETGRLMTKGALGDMDALTRGGIGVALAGLGLKLGMVIKVGPLKDFVIESLLVRDDLGEEKIRQTLSSHKLRQDLFDLMAGAWNSAWINPYVPFVRALAVIAYGATVDTFGVTGAKPVVKTQLPIGVFQNSERGIRDIRDLALEVLHPMTS